MVYFKDRQSVFFSLLTSIIVLVLYILFLKKTYVDSMNGILNSYEGLSLLISEADINSFANLVMLTGILGSAMITVPYNCLTLLVSDKENKIDYDIISTPVKRGQIILSYFVSAAVSSVIMTGIILTAGLIIAKMQSTLFLGTSGVLAAYGIVALGSISATALFMLFIQFFKSASACGAFFGILSAASGFIIGAYIPISQFSDGVQTICNIFPASQITILFRNVLLNGVLEHMNSSLGGMDGGMFAASLKNVFTFKASAFGKEFGISSMLVYVVALLGVSIVAQVLIYKKTYKKK